MFRSLPVLLAALVAVISLTLHFPETSLSARQLVAEKSAGETAVGIGSGIAVFQDIQVPINEEAGVRGDGKLPAEEYQNHTGLSLQAHAGYILYDGRWRYRFGFDAIQARSTDGPAATQSSSYTRMHLGSAVSYQLTRSWNAGMTLGVRRSAYKNVSTGHFIDSVLTGLTTEFDASRDWSIGADFQVAPQSGFYYDAGNSLRGNRFTDTTTALAEYRLVSAHRLYKETWLNLGVSQEVAKVVIPDITAYNAFGLNVSPSSQPGRNYNLSTTLITIGFDKRF